MKDLPVDSWKASLIPEVNIDPKESKWEIINTMNVSYKHSESVYQKASNEVLISFKYHRRYENNDHFDNWIIP